MLKTPKSNKSGLSHSRIIDFGLYLLIAAAFITTGFVVSIKWGDAAYIRWFGFSVDTILLYGYFLSISRELVSRLSFWIVVGAFLCLHAIVFVPLLLHIAEWRLTWSAVMIVELPALIFARDKLSVYLSRPK